MHTFSDLGLSPAFLPILEELNITNPTPVQHGTIPFLINSTEDLVALAPTGSGKTAAFALPLLERMKPEKAGVQSIVLVPTRELCLQVAQAISRFSEARPGTRVCTVYGGTSMLAQKAALRSGADIVVGTPGRVLDLLQRGWLNLSTISQLVLDEADEMLSMGFYEDLREILSQTPTTRRTLLFSATMPPQIEQIAGQLMSQPQRMDFRPREGARPKIDHHCYICHPEDRFPVLNRILLAACSPYAIVFCRTRQDTRDLCEQLNREGHRSDALHGDLSQAQREQIMAAFRSRKITLLIATDVAARGLDVPDLSHVINWDVPQSPDVYTHRSGRTGRAGSQGLSLLIGAPADRARIRFMERKAGITFSYPDLPSVREVHEEHARHWLKTLEQVSPSPHTQTPLLDEMVEAIAHWDKKDLLARMMTLNLPQALQNEAISSDREPRLLREQDRRQATLPGNNRKSEGRSRFVRLSVNLGRRDSIQPLELLQLLAQGLRNRQVDVGKIEIQPRFSIMEIDTAWADAAINGLCGMKWQGRPLFARHWAENSPTEWTFQNRFPGKRNTYPRSGSRRQASASPNSARL